MFCIYFIGSQSWAGNLGGEGGDRECRQWNKYAKFSSFNLNNLNIFFIDLVKRTVRLTYLGIEVVDFFSLDFIDLFACLLQTKEIVLIIQNFTNFRRLFYQKLNNFNRIENLINWMISYVSIRLRHNEKEYFWFVFHLYI